MCAEPGLLVRRRILLRVVQDAHSGFGALGVLVERVLGQVQGQSEDSGHPAGELQELRVVSEEPVFEPGEVGRPDADGLLVFVDAVGIGRGFIGPVEGFAEVWSSSGYTST